ncbi:hypothetical protein HK101_004908 [Irineochytrium annulatum]|nr:hypothetical protein HK101_004908 [Irineochytrium annulatum]
MASPALNTHSKIDVSNLSSDDILFKIVNDHNDLRTAAAMYTKAQESNDETEQKKWFNQFIWEVSRHSVGEEITFYPMLEKLGDEGVRLVEESRADHTTVKELLSDLLTEQSPSIFDAKMSKVMRELEEHMDKEERGDLIFAQQADVKLRESTGRSYAFNKSIAPTRPHPSVPDKPVALEAALGVLMAPIDKFRDLFTAFPDKSGNEEAAQVRQQQF